MGEPVSTRQNACRSTPVRHEARSSIVEKSLFRFGKMRPDHRKGLRQNQLKPVEVRHFRRANRFKVILVIDALDQAMPDQCIKPAPYCRRWHLDAARD